MPSLDKVGKCSAQLSGRIRLDEVWLDKVR